MRFLFLLALFDYEPLHSFIRFFLKKGAVLLARFAEEVNIFHEIIKTLKVTRPNLQLDFWDAEKCAIETHSRAYIGGLYQPRAGQFQPPTFIKAVALEAQNLGLSK